MNHNHQDLPPALREALDREPEAIRSQVEQTWHLLGQAEPPALDVPGDDAAWADLQRHLGNRPKHRAQDRVARHSHRKRWIGVAAGLSMVLLVAGIWWQQPVTVIANPGEQLSITFPDGSTALLNSGTRVQYRRRFAVLPVVAASQRRVRLEGEAFFEVRPADHAFVVETFNAEVEVLGTVFNVRARQAVFEQETRVTMVEGQVRVRARAAPDYVWMLTETGQEARITADTVDQTEQLLQIENIDNVLAWRTQGFAVVDRPIAMILAEIERRYALDIEAEQEVALTDSMSLFYLSGTTPERILHDLCLAQGCTYRKSSTGFVLAPLRP